MEGLLFAALLPALGALLLPIVTISRGGMAGWIAASFVAISWVLTVAGASKALHEPILWTLDWAPNYGWAAGFRFDALSALFALVITSVATIVFTYSAAYLGRDEHRRRFACFLLLFLSAMLGVILADNLVALFTCWELTSITSFLLIGFWHERKVSREGAMKALVITGSGGLLMLVGFVLLGIAGDTFSISGLIENRAQVLADPRINWAAALIIVGAITKSAQAPFHVWLPSAMAAPTPVSALLHSATMVKAGLFLVARFGPLLSGVWLWTPTLTAVGMATMVWGGMLALRQRDLKGLLAFSTVSQLGLILSMLAASDPEMTAAGLLHLCNHAAFKGALFLMVGVIEHEAHTRDVTRLGPLRREMPYTWMILAVAALSMAGIPPLGGFVSKEMFLEHWVGGHLVWNAPNVACGVAAVLGSILTAGYSFALVFGLATGRVPATVTGTPRPAHDPSPALLWGPFLLAALCLAFGLAPQAFLGGLVSSAAGAATGQAAPHLHLALWHGFGPALAASLVAVTGGGLFYYFYWSRNDPKPEVLRNDKAYDWQIGMLQTGSRALTASYMSGLVWRYILIILFVLTGGVAGALYLGGVPPLTPWNTAPAEPLHYLVAAGTIAAVVGTCAAPTRLAAILALGASGYGLAVLFTLFGAPDLALTQIMVETVAMGLFLAVFVYLPPFPGRDRTGLRPLHLAVSAVVGCGIPALLLLARSLRSTESIASYFLENSVGLAGGHNVVNVILVDFRGLDTMGEITVLGIVALACVALLGRHRLPTGRDRREARVTTAAPTASPPRAKTSRSYRGAGRRKNRRKAR